MVEGGEHPFGACANCGKPFQLGVEYPVTTSVQEGELEVYSFCDEDCMAEWEDARGFR